MRRRVDIAAAQQEGRDAIFFEAGFNRAREQQRKREAVTFAAGVGISTVVTWSWSSV